MIFSGSRGACLTETFFFNDAGPVGFIMIRLVHAEHQPCFRCHQGAAPLSMRRSTAKIRWRPLLFRFVSLLPSSTTRGRPSPINLYFPICLLTLSRYSCFLSSFLMLCPALSVRIDNGGLSVKCSVFLKEAPTKCSLAN